MYCIFLLLHIAICSLLYVEVKFKGYLNMKKSEVVAVIQKGKQGIKKWERKYGKDLVCVRYRNKNGKRLITVELVVDEYERIPQKKIDYYLKLSKEEYKEHSILIEKIKKDGGHWHYGKKLWKINKFSKIESLIKSLNLEDHIQEM